MAVANNIIDVIVPIIIASKDKNGFKYETLLGTGFYIGKSGYVMTAGHVLEQAQAYTSKGNVLGVMLIIKGQRYFFEALSSEKHPAHDIGLLQLPAPSLESFLVISNTSENQTCEFHMWSYPEEIADLAKHDIVGEENGRPVGRGIAIPELVFFQGYIRRRISKQLHLRIYTGDQFYEISEIGGACCSGSPIISKRAMGKTWPVIAIYIGENSSGQVTKAGYAVRLDQLYDWRPSILKGKSILEESMNRTI